MKTSIKDRILANVRVTPSCWEWIAGKCEGYGCLSIGNRTRLAHRIAHELFIGPIPKGLCVLHRCDNRGCVNPKHLFLGTKGDNARDAKEKGRNTRGQIHGSAKLSNDQARKIKTELLPSGMSKSDIARTFGISRRMIRFIEIGHKWNCLNESQQ